MINIYLLFSYKSNKNRAKMELEKMRTLKKSREERKR